MPSHLFLISVNDDDPKIRQCPRPGIELAEAQEGGLGEAGEAAAGGEAGSIED